MNGSRFLITLAATAGLAGAPAWGAEDETQAEREARLEAAQARLEEAAREIASLTEDLVGGVGDVVENMEHAMRRPMLGINIGPVGDVEDREDGVLVKGVTPHGPADEAGLRSGDVLVAIGETRLDWSEGTSPVHKLREHMADAEVDQAEELAYRRDGSEAAAQVTPRNWMHTLGRAGERIFSGPLPRAPAPPAPPLPDTFIFRHMLGDRWSDMEMVELTPALGEYFDTEEGVLIVRAPQDDTLGLRDGDVILEIGGRKPADPGHVVRILRSYAPGENLELSIVRKGRREVLQAQVPQPDRAAMRLAPPHT